jgi:hypothetical protein
MSLYGFTGLQKEGKSVLVLRVAVHVLLLKETHEGWRTSDLVQVKLCSSLAVPSFYFSYYNAIDFPLFTTGPLKITGRYEILLVILLNQLIFSCQEHWKIHSLKPKKEPRSIGNNCQKPRNIVRLRNKTLSP